MDALYTARIIPQHDLFGDFILGNFIIPENDRLCRSENYRLAVVEAAWIADAWFCEPCFSDAWFVEALFAETLFVEALLLDPLFAEV